MTKVTHMVRVHYGGDDGGPIDTILSQCGKPLEFDDLAEANRVATSLALGDESSLGWELWNHHWSSMHNTPKLMYAPRVVDTTVLTVVEEAREVLEDPQFLENCSLEWDRGRGAVHVTNKKTGTTILRIHGLAVARNSVSLGDDGRMIDIDVKASRASVPVV